ncbi:hypothetical protein LTR28_011662 [Elasticomyces elasticus]|nr:hypothetical protein LTR28_011662 [Elasticomyces elasticus]
MSAGRDECDVEADVLREQQLARRYGGGSSAVGVAGPSEYARDEGEIDGPVRPDYSGANYAGWDGLQHTRHHHLTRLSDVVEEDEGSRGTGD